MSRIFSSSFSHSQTCRSSHPLNLDNEHLLSPHDTRSERSNSISMQTLSPKASRRSAVSPSPPPTFHRNANTDTSARSVSSSKERYADSRSETLSPSPSRTKVQARDNRNGGRVQFAGPPPPIASAVLLPRQAGSLRSGQSSLSLDGAGRHTSSSATTMLIRTRRGSNSGSTDPLLGLERRERAIQRELQELLDAQSAGLVQGFGGQGDEVSEAGSSTPTYNSVRSRSAGRRESGVVVPVRQPKKKPISLRGARRGLLRDIGELVSIKQEELGVLEDSVKQREEVLRKVGLWEGRIQGFQKQLLQGIGEGRDEEGRELAELMREERAVENEILEMEERLLQMRARRKWLGERIKEGENRREARLSSWRGGLKEVEDEVKEFLKRPPVFATSPTSIEPEEYSFTTLPVGRRTLGMARELWTHEIDHLGMRTEAVEKEKEALEHGAKMWSESINAVLEFEDRLRKQMAGDMQDTAMLQEQVFMMGQVIKALENNLKVAESNGWNLLICALGAELEAFREGEGILRGALGMVEVTDGGEGVGGVGAVGGSGEMPMRQNGGEGSGSGIQDMNVNGEQDSGKRAERENSLRSFREDSEDEGPNLAELLVDNSQGRDGDCDGENSID